jgi:hypothetical protein
MIATSRIVLGLWIVLGFTGCSKPRPDHQFSWSYDTSHSYPKDRHQEALEEARAMVAQAAPTCRYQSECSPSVGLLAYSADTKVGMCSASLIAPNRILTNSHCVSLKPDTMQIVFPAVPGFHQKRIKVRRIIYASPIELDESKVIGKRSDYALLELDEPSDRPVLNPSVQGIRDDEDLISYVMTPTSDRRVEARMDQIRCKSVMNSALQPGYVHPFAETLTLSHCKVVSGNSGSPLLNREGKLVGVIHAGIPEEKLNEVKKALEINSLVSLSLATNLACLSEGGFGPAHELCASSSPPLGLVDGIRKLFDGLAKDQKTNQRLETEMHLKLSAWTARNSSRFEWAWVEQGEHFTLAPKCMKPTSEPVKMGAMIESQEVLVTKLLATFTEQLKIKVEWVDLASRKVVLSRSVDPRARSDDQSSYVIQVRDWTSTKYYEVSGCTK